MRRVAPLAAYLFVATLFTWPLVLHPTGRLAALEGPGDPYLNLWALGWNLQTLSDSPQAVLSGRVFDANVFHPARQTLAYSDHLLLQSALVWPIYAATGDVVVCYNLLFVASLAAAALAMYVFAKAVTGSAWGAAVAGLIWGFWPYHFSHLAHLQLQPLYFLPLAFLFLHRVVAGLRWRDAIGLGATAALQAVSSVYYGVIGTIGLLVAAVALASAVGRWRSAALARRLLLAGLVGAILVAPAVAPYWQVQRREGFARTLFEAGRHSASLASYASVPPVNLLYGRSGLLAHGGPEHGLFLGLAALLLAALGLWRARRTGSRPIAIAMAAVALTGFALSFGPDGLRSLYAALYRTVFGFQAIRAPARFAVLAAFGLAVLAALGLRELGRRGPSGSRTPIVVPAVALTLLGLEYANAPIPFVEAPPRRTAVGQWLRDAPEPGAVLHLPLGLDVESTPAMVQSLEHGRPIVNGYSGQRPPFYTALAETLSRFPSDQAMWALKELDVRFVVSQRPVAVGPWPLVERARLSDPPVAGFPAGGVVYEVRWTPEAEARLAVPRTPPPPPPGPAPFGVGELARYDIVWVGGASALPAGTATLVVQPPGRSPAAAGETGAATKAVYRFVATAETAGWVTAFFEARDRFETTADHGLRPLVHERHLREGRRTVDRILIYDHERHVVRLADAGTTGDLSLRIAPETRDALAALYYARSLPLAKGDRVSVPLNDLGRNSVLELYGGGVEAIVRRGSPDRASRVEARLVQMLQRRRPVEIVAWLSLDGRRVPVAFEVATGFGSFRGALVEYVAGR